jgi:hypothetical protein
MLRRPIEIAAKSGRLINTMNVRYTEDVSIY